MTDLQGEFAAIRAELAALAARVSRLEGSPPQAAHVGPVPPSTGVGTPSAPARPAAPVGPSLASSTPLAPLRPPTFATAPKREKNLERTIGKYWLNRIGIIAVLIGVSYFVKYAFDSGWIGPAGRIALGLLAGIGLVLWSERFRNKGYLPFSYSLKAVGIGTLYLSLWGAFQIYHLVPASAAFVAMIIVTGSTIMLALTQNAEVLAAFAMTGGFSTPVLLSTGQNREIVLFSYVALLDLAILGMVMAKPWRRLLVGSFVGTVILYAGWYSEYYTRADRLPTTIFALLFAAIFATIPLLTPLTKSRWHAGFSITLTLLPLVNAVGLFLALNGMYANETLTWFALGLAGAYLMASNQFKRRAASEPDVAKTINLLHVAIAIAFITIAIPLKLDSHWITIGWLIESGVLLFISVRRGLNFLRYFAGVTLTLGIARLLIYDNFQVETLIFNSRFATYLVAIAILAGIVAVGDRVASERERPVIRVAGVALNVLALVAMTLEASDYFTRQLTAWYQAHPRGYDAGFQQIAFARHFSYSAIWLIYGAALMIFGFRQRSSFVRWQALGLIAFTIGKVFIFDVEALQQGYRILSFIALGAVLMGLSYIYHRDWLKLGAGPEEHSSEATS